MLMFKKFFKPILKKNRFVFWLLTELICFYLKIVYVTSRWQFVSLGDFSKRDLLASNGILFAMWHNNLAFGPGVFKGVYNTYALVSSHSDGRIISAVIKRLGFKIIEGSSNKNPTGAVRQIIDKLARKGNIVITPDGPRGPVHKVNSGIMQIARKYDKKPVPISCSTSNYFVLKTWDRLIMPLPFGKIVIKIGQPLEPVGDRQQDNLILERSLSV